MYADEGELVDVTFDTPNATDPEAITWSATGLPDGLSIDSDTGEITGQPEYYDAQTNGGNWDVALTATDTNGDTDTLEFTWVVSDVNRLDWIDDQVSRVGVLAMNNFEAHDAIGNTLTYEADGLPDGLSLDSYGYIEGSMNGSDLGDYHVTVDVTGGGATDERDFIWTVESSTFGGATFKINGTRYHFDDVGQVGQATPAEMLEWATTADVKVEVMTDNGDGTYSPSDRATLTFDPETDPDGSSELDFPFHEGEVSPGGSFYVIPQVPSDANDDILLVAFRMEAGGGKTKIGEGSLNGVHLTIGTGLDTHSLPNEGADRVYRRE